MKRLIDIFLYVMIYNNICYFGQNPNVDLCGKYIDGF